MVPRPEDEDDNNALSNNAESASSSTTKNPTSERSIVSTSSKSKKKKNKTKKSTSKKDVKNEEAEEQEEEALSSTKKSTASKSKKKKKKKKKKQQSDEVGEEEDGDVVPAEDPPALRGSEMMRLKSESVTAETATASSSSAGRHNQNHHNKKVKKHVEDVDVIENGEEGAIELSQKKAEESWDHDNGDCDGGGDMNGHGNVTSAKARALNGGEGGEDKDVMTDPNSSLNKIYGSTKGAIATFSLILNAGVMIYAHLGLSAVVMSNQPPIPEVNPNPTLPPTPPGGDNSTTGGGGFTGACNEDDYVIWLTGGELNRTVHSTFCSLEYNDGGCLLDEQCISECFQRTFGYSVECSACFSAVPNCGVTQGCALTCASDPASEDCESCNLPCTQQLDQCLGFPDESDQGPPSPPVGSELCTVADVEIWNNGGDGERASQSDFCSRTYNGGCLLDEPCIQECFQTTYGYSSDCSTCFSAVVGCGFAQGCAIPCITDSFSEECATCNIPCIQDLESCIGVSSRRQRRDLHELLPQYVSSYWEAVSDSRTERLLQGGAPQLVCPEVDMDSIDQWYEVYRLTFVDSIQKAWQGDAIFLAFLIVVFSGIWPYAKNLILIYAWYAPLTVEKRTSVLTWLLRLSKYTLVDVFAVVAVLVGVQLELNIAGQTVVTRAEPRPAIIAFFVATLWEFVQIEWTVFMHNRHVQYDDDEEEDADGSKIANGDGNDAEAGNRISHTTTSTNICCPNNKGSSEETKPSDGNFLMAMRFRTKFTSNKTQDSVPPTSVAGIYSWMGFLLVSTLALYLSGSVTELVNFTTSSVASPTACVKSYNLVSFGNGLINALSLQDSTAPAGTWTLYIAYIVLVVFLPIVVHLMQICVLAVSALTLKEGDDGSSIKKLESVCHAMSSLFGFSSIEVLLIGIFAVEHKFEDFVAELAGAGNAAFFSIRSDVGVGFYILIVYSFASGFLQYFIHCCETEYFKIDPYHKVHVMWTKLFGCWLKKN
jgi:hypothetical protein